MKSLSAPIFPLPILLASELLVSAQIAHIHRKQEAHEQAMLTEIYIEALLVDEELADQAWQY